MGMINILLNDANDNLSGKKELKESIFQIKMIGIEPTPYEV